MKCIRRGWQLRRMVKSLNRKARDRCLRRLQVDMCFRFLWLRMNAKSGSEISRASLKGCSESIGGLRFILGTKSAKSGDPVFQIESTEETVYKSEEASSLKIQFLTILGRKSTLTSLH